MAKMFCIAALAATAFAIPQHAEHMGNAQIARRDFSLAARDLSYDGSCGSWSGKTCGGSDCCGASGWCGSSSTHCGAGCQNGFGKCDSGSSAPPAPAPAAPAPVVPPSSNVAPPPVATTSSTSAVAPPPPATTAPKVAPAPSPNAPKNPGVPAPDSSTPAQTSPQAPATSAQAAPSSGSSLSPTTVDYHQYSGDGSTGAGWPSMSDWLSFEQLWANNVPVLKMSCGQYGVNSNSDTENYQLQQAINKTSTQYGVDNRLALVVAIAESGGCVRAPTTKSPPPDMVTNPGIFQDHDGQGHCQTGTRESPADVQDPCPQGQIDQMAADGVGGTAAGDGLAQVLKKAETAGAGNTGPNDAATFYKAARMYNSGSIGSSNKLEDGVATHCYASDIANRLRGWTTLTVTPCTFDKKSS